MSVEPTQETTHDGTNIQNDSEERTTIEAICEGQVQNNNITNTESDGNSSSKIDEVNRNVGEESSSTTGYENYITYAEDGTAILTDPTTNYQYILDKVKNQWVPKDGEKSASDTSNPYESEHYRWCTETKKWLLKEGASTEAENPYENEHYIWNPGNVF